MTVRQLPVGLASVAPPADPDGTASRLAVLVEEVPAPGEELLEALGLALLGRDDGELLDGGGLVGEAGEEVPAEPEAEPDVPAVPEAEVPETPVPAPAPPTVPEAPPAPPVPTAPPPAPPAAVPVTPDPPGRPAESDEPSWCVPCLPIEPNRPLPPCPPDPGLPAPGVGEVWETGLASPATSMHPATAPSSTVPSTAAVAARTAAPLLPVTTRHPHCVSTVPAVPRPLARPALLNGHTPVRTRPGADPSPASGRGGRIPAVSRIPARAAGGRRYRSGGRPRGPP
jgi:hypothetical protein